MPAQPLPAFVPTSGGTVIVVCQHRPTDEWSKLVAKEFGGAAVLFVCYTEGNWTAAAFRLGTREKPSLAELESAGGFLALEGTLKPGEQVVFYRGDSASSAPAEAVTVVVPDRSPTGVRDQILTDHGMDTWISQHNATGIFQILQSLRSAMGVIPFLGAGMSFAFRYPLWGQFFKQFAEDARQGKVGRSETLTQNQRDNVFAMVDAQQFEDAADELMKWDQDAFYDRVRNDFGRKPQLGTATPLTRLPLIAPGPIITTNVDPVVEAVYQGLGRPFTDDRRILGAINHPDQVVTALQQNWNALIKLHGDAEHRDSLIFTRVEYDNGYGDIDKNPGPIERLATVIYTNRPLLFMGCSLETDRTLTSLENVHRRNHFIGHYAVLSPAFRKSKRDERLAKLAAAGIRPLWFYPDRYPDIEALLDILVERTALDELAPARPSPPVVTGSTPTSSAGQIGDLPPSRLPEQIESMVDALMTGQLVFFLGAAVHPHPTPGLDFYQQICKRANIEWPSRDRTDAAQYLADVNPNDLSNIVSELIKNRYAHPAHAHHVLAALSSKSRHLSTAPLMIVTTNYDAATEAAFTAINEPYHLFVYHHSGPYAGKFLHRRPDGAEYAIRTPAAIRAPLAETAIVKLNGGIDPLGRWPEPFVVASSDFEELSTRLGDVLPQLVWDALKTRPILFLGHGLGEPDVRSLIRRRGPKVAPKSWALQLDPVDKQYWRALGIELIDADLNVYLDRLESALTASHSATGSPAPQSLTRH